MTAIGVVKFVCGLVLSAGAVGGTVLAMEGGASTPAPPDAGVVAAHVAVVGLGRNILASHGLRIDSLGRKGVSDEAAAAIADLIDETETSGVTVYASFSTVLPIGQTRKFARGIQFPTSTVVNPGGGAPASVGFGGYASTQSTLRLEARAAAGDAVWVDVGYEIEQPSIVDETPPVKTTMSGSYVARLSRGELGVGGGRLGSELESGFVFVVVRLAGE